MLGDVIAAIDNEHKLELVYQSFEGKLPSRRIIFPYFIKEYKHRWYLLGVPANENDIKTYAFDRIKELNVVEEKFDKNVPFDASEYFRHSFGIITPKDEVTEIHLRFDKVEAPYVISLPIHHTQKIIKETKNYLDISIQVRISYELKEFILSKTPRVKVMSPEHLSKEITMMLLEGQKIYEKKASRN